MLNAQRIAETFEQLPCCKGELPMPRGQRILAEHLAAALQRWLDAIKPKVFAWAQAQLPVAQKTAGTYLFKSEPPLDFGINDLTKELEVILSLVGRTGAADAIGAMGVNMELPSAEAQQYARDRAAEMVGRRRDENGLLIENPNAEWAITDALREDIKAYVERALAEGWSGQKLAEQMEPTFGSWRAETIARTETGWAYGTGAAMTYEQAGVQYVKILDGPGCLPDGHQDGAPPASGEVGVLEPGNQADGQIWLLGDYQEYVLGHPNCVRAAVPYVDENAVPEPVPEPPPEPPPPVERAPEEKVPQVGGKEWERAQGYLP